MRGLAAACFLLLGSVAAYAGGADPGPRAPAVGFCLGEPELCEAGVGGCFKYLNDCVDGACPGTEEPCGVAHAAFAGQLIITIDDEPPLPRSSIPDCGPEGGTTTANVTLLGTKQDGSSFTISRQYGEATTCNVQNCDNQIFFCTTDMKPPDETEPLTRVSENIFPTASWLTVHPFPGDMDAAIRAQFPGVPGMPVMVRVALVDIEDHGGETDPLPTTVRYCVKVHFAPTE